MLNRCIPVGRRGSRADAGRGCAGRSRGWEGGKSVGEVGLLGLDAKMAVEGEELRIVAAREGTHGHIDSQDFGRSQGSRFGQRLCV